MLTAVRFAASSPVGIKPKFGNGEGEDKSLYSSPNPSKDVIALNGEFEADPKAYTHKYFKKKYIKPDQTVGEKLTDVARKVIDIVKQGVGPKHILAFMKLGKESKIVAAMNKSGGNGNNVIARDELFAMEEQERNGEELKGTDK